MRYKYLGALVGVLAIALAALGGTALAKAGKGPNHRFDLTFTSKKPGTATGIKQLLTDRYNYTPQAFGKQANPATGITFTLPKDTKVDLGVISKARRANCTQAKLGTSGDPGPAGRKCVKLGAGSATANVAGILVPGRTLLEAVTVYAGDGVLIARLQGQQTVNIFLRVLGNKFVVSVPKLCAADPFPQTPWCDAEVVLLKVNATIGKRTSGKGKKTKTLVRTPRTCPKSKKWTSSAAYTFRTGPGEKVKATSACTRK